MQRKRGRFRAQMLVSCPNRALAQQTADTLVARAEALAGNHSLRWSLDVDPQDMMRDSLRIAFSRRYEDNMRPQNPHGYTYT